jgi:hypothetical protein
MTPAMIRVMEKRDILEAGFVRAPPTGETSAKPHPDEVIIFRDFFTAGLRFPLDPAMVKIFKLFGVLLHQMTPTLVLRLSLYMWLTKTCKLTPSAEGFAHAFCCHFQLKTVVV